MLDARQHRAILLHHVGAALHARRHHAAGKFLKGLVEDLLRAVAIEHGLIQRYAGKPRCNGLLRDAFGRSFGFEVRKPGVEIARTAGNGGERGLGGHD
ncbi:hypothetical protein ACVWXO_008509 [Bradyrhizobium sp. LM2.7]